VALSDDQKAMLRLLAQREEGYEDMAALMGLSVEDVRAKVKEALAEVEDGPADAEAPAPPLSPPDGPTAPSPPPPPPPTPPVAAPTPAAPSRRPRPPRPTFKLKLPKPRGGKGPQGADNRGALIGIGAGIASLVVLVVVLLVGGSGGGGGSSSPAAAGTTEGRSGEIAAAESGQLTQAILSPTSGGNGSGRALFGRFKKNVLLQVEAEGLEPSPAGEAYTIWLYRSPKLVLRIGAVPVGKDGKIAAQFPIPTQLLAYVANGAFDQIDVSLTSEAAYKADLAKAKGEKRLPGYTGESVLRGQITGPAIKKQ
jgi:hypothetical protein